MAKHRVDFSGIAGKAVESVAFHSSADQHSIEIIFKDATALTIDLVPGLSANATLSDWKTGDQRVLHRWPSIKL
jgi:hypothetical protein